MSKMIEIKGKWFLEKTIVDALDAQDKFGAGQGKFGAGDVVESDCGAKRIIVKNGIVKNGKNELIAINTFGDCMSSETNFARNGYRKIGCLKDYIEN